MSRTIVEHGQEFTPPEESGGIVTTVKNNESKDLDFQARLRQMRIDNGEDPDKVEEVEPVNDAKPKEGDEPAAADDWQKDLTPAQRKEVNEIFKDRKMTKKQLRAANDRLAQLETEVKELKNGGQQPARQAAQPPAGDLVRPTKPDPLKFEGTEEEFKALEQKYEDDLFDYRKEKELREQAAERQKEEDKKVVQRFNTQVDEFAKATPDYGDVMDEADNEVSDLMFGAIVEEGPALGYYFATHPDESAKVARMNERDAVKAIMRIVIKLEEKPAPKQKEEKPTPPSQVPARGAPAAKSDQPMSLKDKERKAFKEGRIAYDPG